MKLLLLVTTIILSSCEAPNQPTKLPNELISEVVVRDFEVVNKIKTDFTNKETFKVQIESSKNYEKARFYLNGSCSGEYKEFTKDEIDNGADLELLQNQENNIKAVFMNIDGIGVNSDCKDIANITHDNIPPKQIPLPVESMRALDGKTFKEKNVTMDIREMSIPEGLDKIILYSDPEGKEILTTINQDDINKGSINFEIKDNTTTSVYMAYVDKANNVGEISESVSSYTHDDIKPEITTVAQNSIFAPGDLFEGTCKDVEKVQISSPLNQEVDCINEKYSFILPNNEGDFEITVSAIDDAGNENAVSVNVLVDGTPPVITSFEPIQKLNGQGTNQNPIELDLSNYTKPSDIESIEIYDENSNLLGTILKTDFESKIYSLMLPENKSTVFKLIAIDRVNNKSEVFNTNTTYTHDNIAPSLTATIASLVKNNTPITGTCETEIKLSGDLSYESICNRGTYSLSIGSMSDGLKSVKVTSSDVYGNKTEKELSFTVDNTPPVIYIYNPMFDSGLRTAELNFKLQSYDINFNQDAVNIKICSNDDCSNIISELSASDYKTNGAMLTLAENAQTTFYIELSDILENSKIYGPYIIETDTSVPDAPTLNEETIALATKVISEDIIKIGGTAPMDAVGVDIYRSNNLEIPVMGFGASQWNNSDFDFSPDKNSSVEYVAFAVNDVGTKSATGVSFKVNHASHPMYDYRFSESDLNLGNFYSGIGTQLMFTVQNKSLEINTGLEVSADISIASISDNIDKVESTCIGKTVSPNETCSFKVFIKEDVDDGEYVDFIGFHMNDMIVNISISYSVSGIIISESTYTDYKSEAIRKITTTINSNSNVKSLILYPSEDKICFPSNSGCFYSTNAVANLKIDDFFVYYPEDNILFFDRDNLSAVNLNSNTESQIGFYYPHVIARNSVGVYIFENDNTYTSWYRPDNILRSIFDNSGIYYTKSHINNIDAFVGDNFIGKNILLDPYGVVVDPHNNVHRYLDEPDKYSKSQIHSILKIDESKVLLVGIATGSEIISETITQRDPEVGDYFCLSSDNCPKDGPGDYNYWLTNSNNKYIELSGHELQFKPYNLNSETTSIQVGEWVWKKGEIYYFEYAQIFPIPIINMFFGYYREKTTTSTQLLNYEGVFAIEYDITNGQYQQKDFFELNKKCFDNCSNRAIKSLNLTDKISLIEVLLENGEKANFMIDSNNQTIKEQTEFIQAMRPYKGDNGYLYLSGNNVFFIPNNGDIKTFNPSNSCNINNPKTFSFVGNNFYSLGSKPGDGSNILCETNVDSNESKYIEITSLKISQIYLNNENQKIAVTEGDDNNLLIIKFNFENSSFDELVNLKVEDYTLLEIINKNNNEFDNRIIEVVMNLTSGGGKNYLIDLAKVK